MPNSRHIDFGDWVRALKTVPHDEAGDENILTRGCVYAVRAVTRTIDGTTVTVWADNGGSYDFEAAMFEPSGPPAVRVDPELAADAAREMPVVYLARVLAGVDPVLLWNFLDEVSEDHDGSSAEAVEAARKLRRLARGDRDRKVVLEALASKVMKGE